MIVPVAWLLGGMCLAQGWEMLPARAGVVLVIAGAGAMWCAVELVRMEAEP